MRVASTSDDCDLSRHESKLAAVALRGICGNLRVIFGTSPLNPSQLSVIPKQSETSWRFEAYPTIGIPSFEHKNLSKYFLQFNMAFYSFLKSPSLCHLRVTAQRLNQGPGFTPAEGNFYFRRDCAYWILEARNSF